MKSKRIFLSIVAFAALSASVPSFSMNTAEKIVAVTGAVIFGSLFDALESENLIGLKLLVGVFKSDVNIFYEDGRTPLYIACEKDNFEMVKFLLPYCEKKIINAEIFNEANNRNLYIESYTALHIACKKGNVRIANLLLKYGADVNSVNNNFVSPIDFACREKNVEIVSLLLSFGAKLGICFFFDIKDPATEKILRYFDLVEEFDKSTDQLGFIKDREGNDDERGLLFKRFFVKKCKSYVGIVSMHDCFKKQLGDGNYRKLQDCRVHTPS